MISSWSINFPSLWNKAGYSKIASEDITPSVYVTSKQSIAS